MFNKFQRNIVFNPKDAQSYLYLAKIFKDFTIICSKLCEKTKTINKDLKNIEPKNESKQ